MRRSISLIMVVLMLANVVVPVNASSVDELQRQQAEYQQKLERTQNQLTQAKKEKTQVVNTVVQLDNAVNTAQKTLNEVETRLSELNLNIATTEKDLTNSTKEFDEKKELLKKRIRAMYIYYSDYSYIDVILNSKNFDDFLYRARLVKNVMSHDRELVDYMDEQIKIIKQKKTDLEKQKTSREKEKEQKTVRMRELDASRAAKNNYLRQIDANIKQLKQMEDYLLEQSEQIEQQIRNTTNKDLKYSDGQMVWPLPGVGKSEVTSQYGNRWHPILKAYRMHTGVDIGAASGRDIVAVNKGKVIFAGTDAGYGNYVIIDHGVKDGSSISTLYAHASKLLVKKGDEVEAGQTIAKVGSTGYSTGPHLHFEVRKNGSHVSPKDYLNY